MAAASAGLAAEAQGVRPQATRSGTIMKVRAMFRKAHFVENHKQLAAVLASVREAYRRAVFKGDPHMIAVQNLSLFALLYNRDLSCILEDFDDPLSDYHQNLSARLAVLTIDECFAKLHGLMGKEVRAAFMAWDLSPKHAERLAGSGKALTQVKTLHAGWIGEIRDNVIGHRDADAAAQFDLMSAIDCARVEQVAMELLSWTNELYTVLKGALGEYLDSGQAAKA